MKIFISGGADGVHALVNGAGTSFNRLCFGGTTASFPAILRSGTALVAMLGDAPEWMTPLLHSARQPGEAWFRRPVVGKHDNPAGNAGRLLGVQTGHGARGRDVDLTTAAGDLSAAFEGYKTQLKGLWEPILVFRKPLGALSIAACAVEHATGAFNVDECRLSAEKPIAAHHGTGTSYSRGFSDTYKSGDFSKMKQTGGRFPPNVVVCHTPACVLDGPPHGWECAPECPVAEIDAQSGDVVAEGLGGGASRFFYRGRATKGERSDGCADLLWVRDEEEAAIFLFHGGPLRKCADIVADMRDARGFDARKQGGRHAGRLLGWLGIGKRFSLPPARFSAMFLVLNSFRPDEFSA
jgi:hypothetical protein